MKLSFLILTTLLLLPTFILAEIEPQYPLRVGIILPFSGEGASAGKAINNGMTLALEKLSRADRKRLQLFYEDDALNPRNTLSAFNKLTQQHEIDVVVNASSGTAKALAPLVEKAQIPLIAIATDPEVVENKKWTVNFWVTPEEQVRVAIPEAYRRGYKRVARVTTIHDFTLSMKRFFDQEDNGRIEMVLDEDFPPDLKDFRSYIAKLRVRDDIDAVLTNLFVGQVGIFAKQARELGVELPLFGFETFEDANEVKLSRNALVGQWYVNTDDPDNSFIDAYKKRFPEASLYGASNGHDIVLLLAEAARRGLDRNGVNEFLHNLKDFTGVLGTYSATSDNRFTLPAAVKIVTEDGFEKLETAPSGTDQGGAERGQAQKHRAFFAEFGLGVYELTLYRVFSLAFGIMVVTRFPSDLSAFSPFLSLAHTSSKKGAS